MELPDSSSLWQVLVNVRWCCNIISCQFHIAKVLIAFLVTNHMLKYVVKEKKTNSIFTRSQVVYIINKEKWKVFFFEQLQMKKHVSRQLVRELTNNYRVIPTKNINVIYMFLFLFIKSIYHLWLLRIEIVFFSFNTYLNTWFVTTIIVKTFAMWNQYLQLF